MIKKNRLTWLGRVECKDGTDWVKHCVTLEVEEIRQKGCSVKEDLVGLC